MEVTAYDDGLTIVREGGKLKLTFEFDMHFDGVDEITSAQCMGMTLSGVSDGNAIAELLEHAGPELVERIDTQDFDSSDDDYLRDA